MCEFCKTQGATNRRQVSNGSTRPDLSKAIAGADAAMKSLDKTMSERQAQSTAINDGGSSMSKPKVREFAGVTREGKNTGEVITVQMQPKEAQQYQPSVPYWQEPRLSAERRSVLENELLGIEAQIANPGDLSPVQVIRLEQAAEQLRRVLGKAGRGDAVPRPSQSM